MNVLYKSLKIEVNLKNGNCSFLSFVENVLLVEAVRDETVQIAQVPAQVWL